MANTPSIHAVILAGGASARFWPKSGDDSPKYLLKPDGKRTLIEGAFARLRAVTEPANIWAVTGEAQSARLQAALPQLAHGNLLIEPARRDTLAAVTLATEAIRRRDANAIVIVTPADVLLTPDEGFKKPLDSAIVAQAFTNERLFSFGVKPARPETGFGYLQRGGNLAPHVWRAQRFVEKPDLDTAQRYVANGDYYWNTGSFAWRAADFIALAEQLQPAVVKAVRAFLDAPAADSAKRRAAYESATAISVDYGVMEKAKDVGVLEVDASFDDIGTWDAMSGCGQVKGAQIIQVESSGCEAAYDGTVAFVGCEDVIVVEYEGKLLVMKKGYGQLVKGVKAAKPEGGNA